MTDNEFIKSYASPLWLKLFLLVGSLVFSLMLVFSDNEVWVNVGLGACPRIETYYRKSGFGAIFL